MIDKTYFKILRVFIAFVFLLNVITFAASGFQINQLINPFYIKDRTIATFLLLKNIILETGVMLKKHSEEEVWNLVLLECEKSKVDPLLIKAIMENHPSNFYTINTDGSMGKIRVFPYMLKDYKGADPFILEDNLKVGISYLGELIKKHDLKKALEIYFSPPESHFNLLKQENLAERVIKAYN